MNIDKHLDVINACRFCFMCRHLATLGNVTYKEADTPRGRALIVDKIRMDRKNLENQDFIKTIYQTPLSAACRYHCVSSIDEAGLILSVRKDIVDSGLAPDNVKAIAEELKTAEFTIEGEGDVLYYIDAYSESAEIFQKITSNCKVIKGGDTGKALNVLGFQKEAAKIAARFNEAVKSSACKTLVVSCPASYDFLKNDFPLEDVNVIHSSEMLLANDLEASCNDKAYYLESDFLKNYNDNFKAPEELLKSLGYELCQFGTNSEESYAVGEGAVVFDRLHPELTKKLCNYVYELADDIENDLFITASPYTRNMLML